MTRISTRTYALPVPVRASDRRGGGAAIVNPVAPVSADRRADGRDLRGRRAYDKTSSNRLPKASLPFATSGRLLVGMHTIGQQERSGAAPDAYECASRYEDRFFDALEPGLVQRRYA